MLWCGAVRRGLHATKHWLAYVCSLAQHCMCSEEPHHYQSARSPPLPSPLQPPCCGRSCTSCHHHLHPTSTSTTPHPPINHPSPTQLTHHHKQEGDREDLEFEWSSPMSGRSGRIFRVAGLRKEHALVGVIDVGCLCLCVCVTVLLWSGDEVCAPFEAPASLLVWRVASTPACLINTLWSLCHPHHNLCVTCVLSSTLLRPTPPTTPKHTHHTVHFPVRLPAAPAGPPVSVRHARAQPRQQGPGPRQ